jgi:Neuraminidase (sialidase)
VNKSTDGGLTWSAPIVLVDENTPEHINDKNSITADPFDSNFVYAVWSRTRFPSDERWSHSLSSFPSSFRGEAFFSRTTDGGATWETSHAIYAPDANQYAAGHQIAVVRAGDHAGRLVDSFTLLYGSGANKKGQEVAVIVSDDRGVTWSDPITVSKMLPGFVSDPDDGTRLRTGDIFPDIGAGPNGEIYVVWQEQTLAPSGSAIAFAKSLDGGQTWIAPVRINTHPDTQAFTPSVEARADGTTAVTHYDLRNNTPDPATLPTDYWFLHSHDGGATWIELRVTPTSFDHKLAPFARGLFLGDYAGLTVWGSDFLTAYATTSAADPAGILISTLEP